MKPILDRVAAGFRSDFRPSNPTELFALRLASRLGEPQAAQHFALLASEHSVEKLLVAFHRTTASSSPAGNLGRRFHTELMRNGKNGSHGASVKLAAIRVERRCLGAAIFRDTRLESVRVRQLPSNPMKAEARTADFVGHLISEHEFESAAIEMVVGQQQIQRAALVKAALGQLRDNSISVWEISKKTVANGFSHPPLKTRRELREVIQTMWPQLNPKRGQVCVLDAVALGLLVQTERLFNNF